MAERRVQEGLRADVHEVGLDGLDHFADVVADLDGFQVALQALHSAKIIVGLRLDDFGLHQRLVPLVGSILRGFVGIADGDELGLGDVGVAGQVRAAKLASGADSGNTYALVGFHTRKLPSGFCFLDIELLNSVTVYVTASSDVSVLLSARAEPSAAFLA